LGLQGCVGVDDIRVSDVSLIEKLEDAELGVGYFGEDIGETLDVVGEIGLDEGTI